MDLAPLYPDTLMLGQWVSPAGASADHRGNDQGWKFAFKSHSMSQIKCLLCAARPPTSTTPYQIPRHHTTTTTSALFVPTL